VISKKTRFCSSPIWAKLLVLVRGRGFSEANLFLSALPFLDVAERKLTAMG
jgi:hypothetical protein